MDAVRTEISSFNLPSLKLTANALENGWLEYDSFLLDGLFSGANLLLVSGRVPYQVIKSLVFFILPINYLIIYIICILNN